MQLSKFDVGEVASKSFDFMTKLLKDAENLVLLIILNLIPIVNFIVLGYFARVVRLDLDEPPKLSDYGDLFIEGLKLFIATLVYALIPLILVALAAWPVVVGGRLGYWPLYPPAALLVRPLTTLGILLLIGIFFIGLPALAIYMRTGDFSKVFAFSEAWDLIQHVGPANYLILFLLLVIFNFVAYAIGSLIPFLGTAIAGVFTMAFTFKALSLFVNAKYPLPPPPP